MKIQPDESMYLSLYVYGFRTDLFVLGNQIRGAYPGGD